MTGPRIRLLHSLEVTQSDTDLKLTESCQESCAEHREQIHNSAAYINFYHLFPRTLIPFEVVPELAQGLEKLRMSLLGVWQAWSV